MKKLIKYAIISMAIFSTTACSSRSDKQYQKSTDIGKVSRIIYSKTESRPSFLAVVAGATVGGVIGYQFGGGSGKTWAAGGGAVVGGYLTDRALTKQYNKIVYEVYIPSKNKKISVSTSNMKNEINKNDVVVVYTKGSNFTIDSYGQYSKEKEKELNYRLNNGILN